MVNREPQHHPEGVYYNFGNNIPPHARQSLRRGSPQWMNRDWRNTAITVAAQALQGRGLIRAAKGRDPLTILWRLTNK